MTPPKHPSVSSLFLTYFLLLLFLAASWRVAYLNLGPWNTAVALIISSIKTILIVLIFMEIRFSKPLVKIATGIGISWFSILLILTLTDYLTRNWVIIPGK